VGLENDGGEFGVDGESSAWTLRIASAAMTRSEGIVFISRFIAWAAGSSNRVVAAVFEATTAAQANQVIEAGAGSAVKVAWCLAIEVAAYQVAAAGLCRVTAALALQAIVAPVTIQRVVAAAMVFVAQGKCRKSE
jgi:hypothetical protein